MSRQVLLVEPSYSNKYPPLGLMKIGAYHKMLGDDVTFVKGISPAHRDKIWDRIYVTTLFSFYWDITIKTIKYYKRSVCKTKDFFIGGILASTLGHDIEAEVGIKPFKGLLNYPGVLDDNNIIIDEVTPDYDILSQIEYSYPTGNSYITYMTRGCVNKCEFCAVPVIEPKYSDYISITNQVRTIDATYGKKSRLLLMDNNVLGSDSFDRIIDEIKDLGFEKDASYIPDNLFEIYCSRLRSNPNDMAAIDNVFKLLQCFPEERLKKYVETFNRFREIIGQFTLSDNSRPEFVENLLAAHNEVSPIFEKYRNKAKKQRLVDFNQGIDARLVTESNMKKLAEINIKPLRIAYDHINLTETYSNAVRLAALNGLYDLSNYILYNYDDKPEEFYYRLENNIKLNKEYGTRIYSFPMKYIPVIDKNRRDFVGKHWSKKYIRAVQSVINVTKGSVAPGESFFYKAFGNNVEEFHKIMMMPEPYIMQRFASEKAGLTSRWWDEYTSLDLDIRTDVDERIRKNNFQIDEQEQAVLGKEATTFLNHYKT